MRFFAVGARILTKKDPRRGRTAASIQPGAVEESDEEREIAGQIGNERSRRAFNEAFTRGKGAHLRNGDNEQRAGYRERHSFGQVVVLPRSACRKLAARVG